MASVQSPLLELFDISGLRVLVTGSGTLATAAAGALALAGATVQLADVHAESLEVARAEIEARGAHADVTTADLSQSAGAEALVGDFVARHGGLDVAVLAARSAYGPGYLEREGRIEETALASWQRSLDDNLHSAFFMMKAITRPMHAAGAGRIIVVASTAGRRSDPFRGYGDIAAGSALVNTTRQAAFELAPQGISVNLVVPGPMWGEVDGPDSLGLDEAALAETVPLGRIGEPRDLEGSIVFLAAPASRYVTGAVLAVDGGSLTRQNAVPKSPLSD